MGSAAGEPVSRVGQADVVKGRAGWWGLWLIAGGVACTCSAVPSALLAQNRPEVIEGRITSPDGAPLSGVALKITGEVDGTIRHTTSAIDGRYRVVFIRPDVAYSILIRRVGFTPLLRRAQHHPSGDAIVVDVRLTPTALEIEPLEIYATRPIALPGLERVSRGGQSEELGERRIFLENGGDLAALVALTPGVVSGPEGPEVLGIGSEQNARLLDGLALDASVLPPDAICGVSFATTSSSPSVGGFAGGVTDASSCKGMDYWEGALRGSFIARDVAWTDPASIRQPFDLMQASGFVSGPLRTGKIRMHASWQASRRASEEHTLEDPNSVYLAERGIAADSLALVRSTAAGIGFPTQLTSRSEPARTNGQGYLVIDAALGAESSLRLTALLTGQTRESGVPTPLSSATRATSFEQWERRGMAQFSTFQRGVLDELTVVIGKSQSSTIPHSTLPGIAVRFGTREADGLGSLAYALLGGGGVPSTTTATYVQMRNQASFTTTGGEHAIAFGQEWRARSDARSRGTHEGAGRFDYQSIADLAANRPSSYSRDRGDKRRRLTGHQLSAWVSDIWRTSRELSLEGGIRIDRMALSHTEPVDQLVSTQFGLSGERLTPSFALSPRLGFALLLHRRDSLVVPNGRGEMVVAQAIDFSEVFGLARANRGSGVTLLGSIGSYAAVLPSVRLMSDVGSREGTGANEQLRCIGASTPVPDWAHPGGATFNSCLGSAPADGGAGFLARQSFYSPEYRAQVAHRINLGVNGLLFHRWLFEPSIVLNRQRHLESRQDINLRADPAFTLDGEAGRPVYGPIASIDPRTGRMALDASRRFGDLGSILAVSSDLQMDVAQASLRIVPPAIASRFFVGIDYTYTTLQRESNGFSGTTAGDPRDVVTERGGFPTHQIVVSTITRIGLFRLGLRGQIESGRSFTPIVAADINADGLLNDRAFLLPLAGQSTWLNGSAVGAFPVGARSCIQTNAGSIAAANSCKGPWSARFDLSLTLDSDRLLKIGRTSRLTLRLVNAGDAISRLAGIEPSGLAGARIPDARLLFVEGFDPEASAFQYRVNGLFGRPLEMGTGRRGYAPFQVQLGVQVGLGGRPLNPIMNQLGWTSDGQLPSEPALLDLLRRRAPNPIDSILRVRGMLALDSAQVERLDTLSMDYSTRLQAVFDPVLVAARASGMKPTDALFGRAALAALESAYQLRLQSRAAALDVLTSDQWVILRSIGVPASAQ